MGIELTRWRCFHFGKKDDPRSSNMWSLISSLVTSKQFNLIAAYSQYLPGEKPNNEKKQKLHILCDCKCLWSVHNYYIKTKHLPVYKKVAAMCFHCRWELWTWRVIAGILKARNWALPVIIWPIWCSVQCSICSPSFNQMSIGRIFHKLGNSFIM